VLNAPKPQPGASGRRPLAGAGSRRPADG